MPAGAAKAEPRAAAEAAALQPLKDEDFDALTRVAAIAGATTSASPSTSGRFQPPAWCVLGILCWASVVEAVCAAQTFMQAVQCRDSVARFCASHLYRADTRLQTRQACAPPCQAVFSSIKLCNWGANMSAC